MGNIFKERKHGVSGVTFRACLEGEWDEQYMEEILFQILNRRLGYETQKFHDTSDKIQTIIEV
jgi:hypothetical protein